MGYWRMCWLPLTLHNSLATGGICALSELWLPYSSYNSDYYQASRNPRNAACDKWLLRPWSETFSLHIYFETSQCFSLSLLDLLHLYTPQLALLLQHRQLLTFVSILLHSYLTLLQPATTIGDGPGNVPAISVIPDTIACVGQAHPDLDVQSEEFKKACLAGRQRQIDQSAPEIKHLVEAFRRRNKHSWEEFCQAKDIFGQRVLCKRHFARSLSF